MGDIQQFGNIGKELFERTDLTPEWTEQMRDMASWFSQWEKVNQRKLVEPIRKLTHGN